MLVEYSSSTDPGVGFDARGRVRLALASLPAVAGDAVALGTLAAPSSCTHVNQQLNSRQ